MAIQGTSATGSSSIPPINNPYADQRASGTSRTVPPDNGDNRSNRTRDTTMNPAANIGNLINPLPGGVSRSPGGEALADANAVLTKLVMNSAWGNALDIRLFPIDHTAASALKISAIVIAVRIKSALDNGVAYQPMILAASAGVIQSKRLKIDGREVEAIRTADNGNDQAMQSACEKAVNSAYPGVPILSVSATTVPTTVNLKDEAQMSRLLVNGLQGCITYLQENAGANNVASLKELSTTMKFVTALSFEHVPLVNDAQLPVRNDFTITLSSNPVTVSTETLDLNDGTESREIMNVRGYVDLAWTAGPSEAMQYERRGPPITARYIPRIIATSVYTGDNSYIALIAIALGMVNALRNNTAWMQAMPMATKPGDLADYGILSMETAVDPKNPRVLEATPFRCDDEGKSEYHVFLNRMILPTPQLCVDVPMCGPETWQLGFLADIANGDMAAKQMLIDTLNELTDNVFGDCIEADDWLVRVDSEIHLGTYRDASGAMRDMREIGYVQVANAVLPSGNGQNNPLQQWSNSWVPTDAYGATRDIAVRLEERLRVQTAWFGAMNVTGMAQRLELSMGLLDGIARAFSRSAFHPIMTGFKSQLDSYNRASFNGHVMGAGHAGDLFRRTSSSADGNNQSSTRYGGRGHRYGR